MRIGIIVLGILAICLAIGTVVYGLMPNVEPKWCMAVAFIPFIGGIALIAIGACLPDDNKENSRIGRR